MFQVSGPLDSRGNMWVASWSMELLTEERYGLADKMLTSVQMGSSMSASNEVDVETDFK